jgi:hypothetical protein
MWKCSLILLNIFVFYTEAAQLNGKNCISFTVIASSTTAACKIRLYFHKLHKNNS